MSKLNLDSELNSLVKMFGEDPDLAIVEVYSVFRNPFLSFSQRLNTNTSDNKDCFQEAVIAVYNNLCANKITENNSKVKTYLFAIGRNKIVDLLKAKKRKLRIETIAITSSQSAPNESDFDIKRVKVAMKKLGQSCQDLLLNYYFARMTIKEISHHMNFKNENTVKANKSRCMKQLRIFVKKVKYQNQ